MIPILLLPLMGLAACGLALALAVHVLALVGADVPGGNAVFIALSGGVFAGILGLIIAQKLLRDQIDEPDDVGFWDGFAGCPVWARYAIRGLHYYVFATLGVLAVFRFAQTGELDLSIHYNMADAAPSRAVWAGFSALWMFFFAVGLGRLVTLGRGAMSGPVAR